ncbi:uncharacterized protein LOC134232094 [Saccostrea cucullata]|uniref:uncharacterized protein LOC134232094 n=1 Tax=Saccostrea cuccullata TaxID=36930 RepID=UPI002ED52E62
MDSSDIMWFCVPCREKVEKNITVDREIEERCNDMMKMFDSRIKYLEDEMEKKCSEEQVREIVSEAIQKSTESNQADTEDETASESGKHTVPVSAVLSEINERKNRECNMIIYGIEESDSDNKEVRRSYDRDQVKEIADVCEVNIADENMIKLVRLGKFNKDKKRRPLLVTFSTPEKSGIL